MKNIAILATSVILVATSAHGAYTVTASRDYVDRKVAALNEVKADKFVVVTNGSDVVTNTVLYSNADIPSLDDRTNDWNRAAGWATTNYLPLAGGEMTGDLAILNTSTSYGIEEGLGIYFNVSTNASGANPPFGSANIEIKGDIDAYPALTITRLLYKDNVYEQCSLDAAGVFDITGPYGATRHLIELPTNRDGTIALAAINPTEGNLAALDASGNPTNSGIKASDKLNSTSAAPAWTNGTAYVENSLVSYNGKIYRCKENTVSPHETAPDIDTTHWEGKPVSELFLPITGGELTGWLTFEGSVGVNNSLFIDENAAFGFDSSVGVLQIMPSRALTDQDDVAVKVPVTNGTLAVVSDSGLLYVNNVIQVGEGGPDSTGFILLAANSESDGLTEYSAYGVILSDGTELNFPTNKTGENYFALAATNSISGNLAALDAQGNPTNSGIKPSDKLDSTAAAPTFDPTRTTPTKYEKNELVSKDGIVYQCTNTDGHYGAWNTNNWTATPVSELFLPLTGGTITGSLAQGDDCRSTGNYSHAEGDSTEATNSYSHAEGTLTCAWGEHSHAEGNHSRSIGTASHAEGSSADAHGTGSHVEGCLTYASGSFSHAEGYGTYAAGFGSHAEGYKSVATNDSSFVFSGVPKAYYVYRVGSAVRIHQNYIFKGKVYLALKGGTYDGDTDSDDWDEWFSETSETLYGSHGDGTFNINPNGGEWGFWIGETTLGDLIDEAESDIVDAYNLEGLGSMAYENDVKSILSNQTFDFSSNVGLYEGVLNCLQQLGASITNAPSGFSLTNGVWRYTAPAE